MNEGDANTPAAAEQPIWSGTSSQVRNLHVYLLCIIVAGAIIAGAVLTKHQPFAIGAVLPLIYAFWRFVKLRAVHYELTTQLVRMRQGLFSRRTDELELYRVKDVTVFEPFWQRMFGLGNIVITTNDASTPQLTLLALPKAGTVREALRTAIEECRDRKRVRIAELE